MKIRRALSFDDVLLEPAYSEIKSRSEIDIGANLGDIRFSLPVISSPMDTVTETTMAVAMSQAGGLGILHRYNSFEDQATMIRDAAMNGMCYVGAAVGVSGDFEMRACAAYDAGARIICVDVAHGHHSLLQRALGTLRDVFDDRVVIIAGNVATPEAFENLRDWGAHAIRVGIGGGSICSTRIQTGHGVPTLQSVLDCASIVGAKLIADGGIRTAGDIVKAIAAGADFVMLGSMLAGTRETPGHVFTGSAGKSYKVYRGMASVEAQEDWRGEVRSLEGVSTTIPYKGLVRSVLDSLAQNIRSGFSYSGALTQRDFKVRASFIEQTQSGAIEGSTHINKS